VVIFDGKVDPQGLNIILDATLKPRTSRVPDENDTQDQEPEATLKPKAASCSPDEELTEEPSETKKHKKHHKHDRSKHHHKNKKSDDCEHPPPSPPC